MPVIDLSSTVLVVRIHGTWMRMPLVCDEPIVRALSLKRRERHAADAETAAIVNARARYAASY